MRRSIKGVLEGYSERSGVLQEIFRKLDKHVERAKEIAQLCNGSLEQFVLSRKISRDIATVKKNVLDLSITNRIVMSQDLHVSVALVVSLVVGLHRAYARQRDGEIVV